MNSARPPWWMFLVAASFIGLHAFIPYLVIWGPADPEGLDAVFEGGAMRIRAVSPDSSYAHAGLQAGDRVLTIGGIPVRNTNDWAVVLFNLQPGRQDIWEISRGGQRLEVVVTTRRATWQQRLRAYFALLPLALSCFVLGLFIAFRRPRDLVARMGAWFIMTASVAFGLPNGWAVPWRQVPAAAQLLLFIPEISRFVFEGIFLSFFVVFPCRLFRARWPWFLIWGPVLATLPWRLSGFYSAIYSPGEGSPVPGWLSGVTLLRTMVYLLAGVLILAVSYRRLADLNERRRVRVLIVGTAISLVSAVPVVWLINLSGYGLSSGFTLLASLTFPGTLACPLAFAYAILRHRVFDIQVILRQGLQYALARGAVLGLIPVLGAVLVFDLAVNSQEPLALILRARGWVYAALGGLALIAYWQRKSWLEALDRRFFRERYNAQRLLREVVGEIREAGSLERVSPRVVARIDGALHPEFVALMVHEPGQPAYRVLASVPAGQAPPPLRADSKVVALAQVLGKPLEILQADSGWLDRRLPREETDLMRRERIDLLVPIASPPGGADALLVLGIKRSEEPYTREDQELLEAIAAGLGLLFGQTTLVTQRPAATLEECPQCGACCDPGTSRCSLDGADLVSVRLPRTLAGRYRLERRRGRGGMGTVYEAVDRALERQVAVKVIREDRVGSADSAMRFQREACSAAAFAHPNVVTVYDYGVEAGTRAFLVMELLQGVTLRDELRRRRRLDAGRTVEIFRGVCDAVEAAHRRRLIHRDLKPENIFLARGGDAGDETVKVLDFGVAKLLIGSDDSAETQTSAETDAGVLVGTAAYMSPEQLLGERPGESWDLWALAVVAYETLTGELPFSAAPREKWLQSVLAGSYAPLSQYLADPPPRWLDFFAGSLAADRTRRPRTAAELLRHMKEALAWKPEQ